MGQVTLFQKIGKQSDLRGLTATFDTFKADEPSEFHRRGSVTKFERLPTLPSLRRPHRVSLPTFQWFPDKRGFRDVLGRKANSSPGPVGWKFRRFRCAAQSR